MVLLMALAIGWTGTNVVAARFGKLDAEEFALRQGAWVDAAKYRRGRSRWRAPASIPTARRRCSIKPADPTHHYAEAHNDYLQLGAEGGLLLALPILLAVVLFLREAAQRVADASDPAGWWIRRGALTGLLAIAAQEMVDFSLQMPANAALFTVLCAIAIHRAPTIAGAVRQRVPHTDRRSRDVRAVFA
jgi:hypothetical protein